MSEYGQLIEAPRVAPAQGSMVDFFAAGQQQDQMLEERSKQILLEMTRQFLGNQMGLPQGVDPMAVQQFQGEQQGQQIRGNIDQRAGQDHQSKYDFANKFIGGLPQQSDPTLGAIQRAGGPQGAEALLNILGNQYGRQGELDNRSAMNNADNAAAQTRLETEIRLKQEADQEKYTIDSTREKDQQKAAFDLVNQFKQTGNEGYLAQIDPKLLTSPVIYDMINGVKTELSEKANAEKKAKFLTDNPPPTPQPQQDPRIAQAKLDKDFPNMPLEEIIKNVIKGTESFGGDSRWKAVRAKDPEMYDAAWRARQKQLQEEQVLRMLEDIKNPRANSTTRIGGY